MSLRLLWWEEPAKEIGGYQFVRYFFGAKDLPMTANYGPKGNAIGRETRFFAAALRVGNKFHMSDYHESSPTVEEATRKAQDLVEMVAKSRFSFTKYVSNVHGVLSILD